MVQPELSLNPCFFPHFNQTQKHNFPGSSFYDIQILDKDQFALQNAIKPFF